MIHVLTHKPDTAAFTLIETLVAVTLLVVSVAAPMSLATQSLSSAFYARDQVTAFHLAQEAVESVRNVRDGNILAGVLGSPTDLLTGIPNTEGNPFTIDTRDNTMESCNVLDGCPPLCNNGELYGYDAGQTCTGIGWQETRFTRSVFAELVPDTDGDEVRVSVEVRWRSGSLQERSFTISENLYKWAGQE